MPRVPHPFTFYRSRAAYLPLLASLGVSINLTSSREPRSKLCGSGVWSLSSHTHLGFFSLGLQPGTEYKITVVPMRGGLEGKPILLNGRTGMEV